MTLGANWRPTERACCICERPHDGSLMRCRPRTAKMLFDTAPRSSDGGFDLCHFCQRSVQIAGSIENFLKRIVEREVGRANSRQWADAHAASGRTNVSPTFMAQFGYTLTPQGWMKEDAL